MPELAEPPTSRDIVVTPEFENSFAAALAADNTTRQPVATQPPAAAPAVSPATLSPPDPPAAPAEDADESDIPEAIKSTKGAKAWASMRKRAAERDTYEAKAKEYEGELAKLKAAPPVNDEFKSKYEETTKKLDEYQKLVRAADLANDPEFKGYFDGKTKTLLGMAKAAVTSEQQATIDKWLVRPESDARTTALEEVVTEIGMLRGQKLAAIINDVDRLHLERDAELEKASSNWNQLLEKRGKLSAEQQSRAKAEADDTFIRALKSTKDKEQGLMLFQEREGDETWNKAVKEREELARKIFNGDLTLEDRAKAAIWAADGAGERMIVGELAKENAALKAELAAIKGGTPSPEMGDVGGGSSNKDDTDNSPEGILRRAQAIDFRS